MDHISVDELLRDPRLLEIVRANIEGGQKGLYSYYAQGQTYYGNPIPLKRIALGPDIAWQRDIGVAMNTLMDWMKSPESERLRFMASGPLEGHYLDVQGNPALDPTQGDFFIIKTVHPDLDMEKRLEDYRGDKDKLDGIKTYLAKRFLFEDYFHLNAGANKYIPRTLIVIENRGPGLAKVRSMKQNVTRLKPDELVKAFILSDGDDYHGTDQMAMAYTKINHGLIDLER